jgi:hypothetical protein
MRGQIVVCKDVIGTPLVRVVWDSSERLIFVHTQDQFDRRMSGEDFLDPVGFPIEDVFNLNETVLAECAVDGNTPWNELAVYNGGL